MPGRRCAWCTNIGLCLPRAVNHCPYDNPPFQPVRHKCGPDDAPRYCKAEPAPPLAASDPGSGARSPAQSQHEEPLPLDASAECAGVTPHHGQMVGFRTAILNGSVPSKRLVRRVDGRTLTAEAFLQR